MAFIWQDFVNFHKIANEFKKSFVVLLYYQQHGSSLIMELTNTLTFFASIASVAAVSISLWRLFRSPRTITVTRKDNGKSVVINTRAGWREGAKLTTLL